MLWDLGYTLLFVIWAIAVVSEPEQGTEPGLCCIRLKQLKEQSESKSWGFLPDLTCSKAATAAQYHSQPPPSGRDAQGEADLGWFSSFCNVQWPGRFSRAITASQLRVLTIFPSWFSLLCWHFSTSESLRLLLVLIFIPDFSQKFSTRCYLGLSSLPCYCSFSRAASGLHGGFSCHVFIRHSPLTFLHFSIFAQGFVYLLYLLWVHMFWGCCISHNCTVWVFFLKGWGFILLRCMFLFSSCISLFILKTFF